MANQRVQSLFNEIKLYHRLNNQEKENVKKLISLSKKDQQKNVINPIKEYPISEDLIVLESGHQPNYLPHAGTWKKAFLLHWIQNKLEEDGYSTIAFFGFADQNISTARLLAKNQIPDLNKNGFTKIGFKIEDKSKWKSFNRVEKPPHEHWENEIEKIKNHYLNLAIKIKSSDVIVRNDLDEVLEILHSSYFQTDNFAELNSQIFTRICREIFELDLAFFRYSVMHHEGLFIDESRIILKNYKKFNVIYNQEITSKSLDIPTVSPNNLPFWYECECGVKLDLNIDDKGICEVNCPVCLKQYHLDFGQTFENLERYYKNMDFSAVSRNIIMGDGLGVSLFVSGTGGSAVYGKISDHISQEFSFHHPITLAWQSRDYYLGTLHKTVVWELMKAFSLSAKDFTNKAFEIKIEQTYNEISENIRALETSGNKQELKRWVGLKNSIKNLENYTQKIFSNTPSFIDLLANMPHDTIIKIWGSAICSSEIQKCDYMFKIRSDIRYPVLLLPDILDSDLPEFYHSINCLGV